DLIVCSRFLGMLPLQMAKTVLSELHRVCKSKAILYMNVKVGEVPARGWVERLIPRLGRDSDDIGGNINEAAFLELAKSAGFDLLQRRLISDGEDNAYYFYLVEKRR